MARYNFLYTNNIGGVEPVSFTIVQKINELGSTLTTQTTVQEDSFNLPPILLSNLTPTTSSNRNLVCGSDIGVRFTRAYFTANTWLEIPIPFARQSPDWEEFWDQLKTLTYIEFDYFGELAEY